MLIKINFAYPYDKLKIHQIWPFYLFVLATETCYSICLKFFISKEV